MTRRRLAATAAAALALNGCNEPAAEPAQVPVPVNSAALTSAPVTGAPATGGLGDDPGASAHPSGTGVSADPAASADFVAIVRNKLPEIADDRRDEEIALIAERACAGLAAGRSADDVIAGTRSLGTLDADATDESTARELIKLAVDTVCLQQARRVDEF